MAAQFEHVLECVQTAAPSCLAGFAPLRSEIPIPSDHNPRSVWQLRCKCGGNVGRFFGYPLAHLGAADVRPDWFVSPLTFECVDCGVATQILDTEFHGYHAVVERLAGCVRVGSAKIRGHGPPSTLSCPKCSCDRFGVIVGFVFWGIDELAEEFASNWEDLFNVFLCYCTCASCGTIIQPTDFGKL